MSTTGGRSAAAQRRSHICNGPPAASLFAVGLGPCDGQSPGEGWDAEGKY